MSKFFKKKFNSEAIHGKYFPHIDGIRALAVLPVVLFHIHPGLCPGGFSGVDVFFVISGYLITGGILRDLSNKQFSIKNFYYRRIRRIMPAYLGIIFTVFLFGFTIYHSVLIIQLANGVTAGTLFISNFHFWVMADDYFSPLVHSQALLHLWSLSVEEQFYFFIPLLCAICWKVNRRLLLPMLVTIAITSLISAVYLVYAGKASIAFYFLPFRAWELLAGSLLAMAAPPPSINKAFSRDLSGNAKGPNEVSAQATVVRDIVQAILPFIGIISIVVTCVVISNKTSFPGLAALPPVVGTMLLIRYANSGIIFRILTWQPVVGIGKISYSLYLWHWPVIVFWKYITFDQLYLLDYVGMFFVSLILAFLSWQYLEMPVRTSSWWTARRTFSFAGIGALGLILLGTLCEHYRGWPTILHARANAWAGPPNPVTFLSGRVQGLFRRLDSFLEPRISIFKPIAQSRNSVALAYGSDSRCSIGQPGKPTVLLLGDSHASSIQYGLDQCLRERNISGYTATWSGTAMFNSALPQTKTVLSMLDESPEIISVILAQNWLFYMDAEGVTRDDSEKMYTKLQDFAEHIRGKGKTLYIVEDIPVYKYSLVDIAARMQIIAPRKVEPEWKSLRQTEPEYDRMQKRINERLQAIAGTTGAVIIPLRNAFKKDDAFIYFDQDCDQPVPLYWDSGHLSQAGSMRAARFILPFFMSQ